MGQCMSPAMYALHTHGMTPVLVASNDARGIVLIVQVPGAVRIDEHSIGIVHEILIGIVSTVDCTIVSSID